MTLRLLTLTSLATLAACGEEPTPASHPAAQAMAAQAMAAQAAAPIAEAPAAPDAPAGECPFFDAALASGILGTDVTVTGVPATGSCFITSEPLTASGQVTVIPNHTVDAIMAGQSAPEPIEGLGEQAAWASTSQWEGRDLGGMVGVEQGGRGVTVILSRQANAPPQADLRERTVALARAVLAGM